MKRFLVVPNPLLSPSRILIPICLLIAVVILASPVPARALSWQPVGSGVAGTRINQLFVWGDVLVVGGAFSTAGGAPAYNIAVWDGAAWSALDDGFDAVNHITEYNGQLVVGGKRPSQTVYGVWVWNGGSWSSLTSQYYQNVTGFQGSLYGTSTFTYGPGGMYIGTRLHAFDGTSWTDFASFLPLASNDPYTTQDIGVLGGQLRLYMGSGGDVHSYNGTSWTANFAAGLFPTVFGMWNGALVTAGSDMTIPFIKEWTGSGWVNHIAGFGELCADVKALTEHNGLLIAGGIFGGGFDCDVPATGHRVLSYDGVDWTTVGAAMDNSVRDLVVYDGILIAAGDFGASGGVPTSLIAQYTEAPVPVAISRLSAREVDAGVELTWHVAADEAFEGFHVYRSTGTRVSRANATMLSPFDRRFVDDAVTPGQRYTYEIVLVDSDGEFRSAPVTIELAPLVIALHQNTPNPFNPSTTIRYVVAQPGHVSIVVYAPDGRAVRRLVNEARPAGTWTVNWDGKDERGSDVATGLYFYRLESGKTSLSRKMVLLK